MRHDDTCENIKRALNGRPGQPIVFGVCKALAARWGKEPWLTRGIAIVAGLFWFLPALAIYVVLGLVLKETEARTSGFFSGLGVIIREWSEKFIRGSRHSFDGDSYRGGHRQGG